MGARRLAIGFAWLLPGCFLAHEAPFEPTDVAPASPPSVDASDCTPVTAEWMGPFIAMSAARDVELGSTWLAVSRWQDREGDDVEIWELEPGPSGVARRTRTVPGTDGATLLAAGRHRERVALVLGNTRDTSVRVMLLEGERVLADQPAPAGALNGYANVVVEWDRVGLVTRTETGHDVTLMDLDRTAPPESALVPRYESEVREAVWVVPQLAGGLMVAKVDLAHDLALYRLNEEGMSLISDHIEESLMPVFDGATMAYVHDWQVAIDWTSSLAPHIETPVPEGGQISGSLAHAVSAAGAAIGLSVDSVVHLGLVRGDDSEITFRALPSRGLAGQAVAHADAHALGVYYLDFRIGPSDGNVIRYEGWDVSDPECAIAR